MSKIDFQNGFALGYASGGVVNNSSFLIEPLDSTVRFISEDKVYHLVTGAVGQEVNAPTISPTSESGTSFFSWYDSNNQQVTFPIIMQEGTKDINAVFSNVNVIMEISNSNDVLFTYNGNEFHKLNNGTAICSYCYDSGRSVNAVILLSPIESNVECNTNPNSEKGTYTYNNVTYYYRIYYYATVNKEVVKTDVGSCSSVSISSYRDKILKATLDKYFMVK